MMKKIFCAILYICLMLMPVAGDAQETEIETEEQFELAAAEYDGYRLAILDYSFNEAWQSYEDDPGAPAICVRFYFENGNEDPLYMLESFGIAAYQDGVELNYISLNSDNEEAQNTTISVMDGAGIYCMMAFEITSDSDVVFQVTEPTADANLLIELELPYDSDKAFDTDDTQGATTECNYDTVLYSDDYIEIELISISNDGADFSIMNNSDQVLQVECE